MGMSHANPYHQQLPDVRPSELVEIVRERIAEQRAMKALLEEAPPADRQTLADKLQLLFEEPLRG